MYIAREKLPDKYEEFIELYKGNFEKRKYFKIDQNLDIIEREPSWILELAFIYYETKNDKIIDYLNISISECYKSKVKKIDRLSKLSIYDLKDKFWRSLTNKDGIHTIRLGNELLLRDKDIFFNMVYKYAFIASDVNKLIKVFFFELIYNKIKDYSELLKNLLNYFSTSEFEYIKYHSKDYLEYFDKNKNNDLYRLIYEKKCADYNIKKIELSKKELLDAGKKVMLEYLKSEGLI